MSSQPKWSLGSWAYEWNANGSLHKIKRADGKVFTFKYDAFGRRISKSYHRREFLYIWDKNVPLHEIQKEELCEDNIITWIFDGFTPTAKLINGKAYSIISDHIGTPILAVDTQGNKVWERELDIYGKVRKEFTHDSVKDRRSGFIPFLYAGQYYDKETDLAYNRFRYYDPNTGSYISQDPIGLLGNNPNIYAYVWDTNTWIDVFGLLGKTYIVYQAIDLDTGKIYTGRTSGDDNLSIRQILDKRQSGHHRNLGQLQEVFVTNSYEAVRGGEQYYIEEMRKKGMATDQINGIAERNFGKNGAKKKGDLYMEAFHAENNKKKITCSE